MRTRRAQHSDDKLLDAARSVFARDGLQAATVEEIATEAGSTKPTFYARFGSKNELYEAAVGREADALSAHLLAAYAEAGTLPTRTFVERAVNAWFEFASERPDGLRLLFFAPASGQPGKIYDETWQRIEEQITFAIGSYTGDPEVPGARLIAAMIMGTCVNAAQHLLTLPELDIAKATALTTAYVTSGLSGADPSLLD